MKPIIFSTLMVQAILDGRKTQTRRAIKPNIIEKGTNWFWNPNENVNLAPYKHGDVLWVREKTYGTPNGTDNQDLCYATHCPCGFSDEEHAQVKGWRSPRFMPKEAARIFLKVTNVRVERLHDITENDARNEGVKDPYDYQEPSYYDQPHVRGMEINKSAFAGLWDSLNKKRDFGWDKNPWVWVVEFAKL